MFAPLTGVKSDCAPVSGEVRFEEHGRRRVLLRLLSHGLILLPVFDFGYENGGTQSDN